MNIPSNTDTKETTEEVVVTDTAVITQDTPIVEEPKPRVSVEGAFKDADRTPANWNIVPTDEGIEASNSNTGSKFAGTVEEFNAKVKG